MEKPKSYFYKLCTGLLFFLSTVSISKSHATTITATMSGVWTDLNCWDLGLIPGCYDTIIIPVGITLTVDDQIDLTACPSMYIIVEGELHFQTGKKIDMPCSSWMILSSGPPQGTLTGGGGGGSSNWVTICGAPMWAAGDGDLVGPAVLCDVCALPIELLSFTANLDNEAVQINWETASELNNDYFTVERSVDGKNWSEIRRVDGAGNSSVTTKYHVTDKSALLGFSYYRLKQTDFNGNYTYSRTVLMNKDVSNGSGEISVFPNPVSQKEEIVITIYGNFNTPLKLSIMSVDGRTVYDQIIDLSGNNGIVLTIDNNFDSGTYVVRFNDLWVKLVVN